MTQPINGDGPQRIRRSREKGWKMPDGTVYVGRPTKWGNPFRYRGQNGLVAFGPAHMERYGREWDYEGRTSRHGTRHDRYYAAGDVVETYVRWGTPAELVELFRLTLTAPTEGMLRAAPSGRGNLCWTRRGGQIERLTVDQIRAELRGKNLACWCPLGQPCHADVLIEIANGPL